MVFTSVLLSLRMSAARLGLRCSPMRVLACLHAVALCHSSWCFSASHLLMSSVTNLFETPITGSRPAGFCFDASLASLSAVSFPLIPLLTGIQWTATWLSPVSLFNATWHFQTSVEVVTNLSSVVMVALLSEQMRMFLPWPWFRALYAHWSMATISVWRNVRWGPNEIARLVLLFLP